MKYRKSSLSKNRASEMFFDSIDWKGGSPITDCQCGIYHYAVDVDECYVDDIPKQESATDRFHNGQSVLKAEIDGKYFVEECDGCMEALARYEQWIWTHRDTIRNYLKTRVDHEKIWADHEHVANILADF